MICYFTFDNVKPTKRSIFTKTYLICPNCGKKMWLTALKYHHIRCTDCLTPIKRVYDIVEGKVEERINYYLSNNLT